MTVLAIDPGTHESQAVEWDGSRLSTMLFERNSLLIQRFMDRWDYAAGQFVVIESVASYGMPVGAEVFDTCYWGGRMYQVLTDMGLEVRLVPRMTVKTHLCHSAKAKDGNIRQALIDRFGGKEKAVGNKKAPGVLYGVSGHGWAALALAVTAWDLGRTIGRALDE